MALLAVPSKLALIVVGNLSLISAEPSKLIVSPLCEAVASWMKIFLALCNLSAVVALPLNLAAVIAPVEGLIVIDWLNNTPPV